MAGEISIIFKDNDLLGFPRRSQRGSERGGWLEVEAVYVK
jgi:hypothetical protein